MLEINDGLNGILDVVYGYIVFKEPNILKYVHMLVDLDKSVRSPDAFGLNCFLLISFYAFLVLIVFSLSNGSFMVDLFI